MNGKIILPGNAMPNKEDIRKGKVLSPEYKNKNYIRSNGLWVPKKEESKQLIALNK